MTDNAGIVFEHSFYPNSFKETGSLMMKDLLTISFYYGDVVKPMFGEEELPKMPCQAVVSTDGSPYFYDRHRTGI